MVNAKQNAVFRLFHDTDEVSPNPWLPAPLALEVQATLTSWGPRGAARNDEPKSIAYQLHAGRPERQRIAVIGQQRQIRRE
jgi:hypothetical protein